MIWIELCDNQPSELRARAKDLQGCEGIWKRQPLVWLQDVCGREVNKVDDINIEMHKEPSSSAFQTGSNFHSRRSSAPPDPDPNILKSAAAYLVLTPSINARTVGTRADYSYLATRSCFYARLRDGSSGRFQGSSSTARSTLGNG